LKYGLQGDCTGMGDCTPWKERRVRKNSEVENGTAPKHTDCRGSCCPLMTPVMLSSHSGSASLLAKQSMALSPQTSLLVLDFEVDCKAVERRPCVTA